MAEARTAVPAWRQLTHLFVAPDTLALLSRLRDGLIISASPSFQAVLGIAPDSMVGRSALELQLWRDNAQRESVMARIRQRGSASAEPVSMQSPDGSHLDGLMSCALIEADAEHYLFTLIQDIRRYDSEAQARQREVESFRALVMASDVAVYRRRVSPPALVDGNPALARMLGADSADALIAASAGSAHFAYADPDHGAWLQQQLLGHGRVANVRAQILRPDGSAIWVSESAHRVSDRLGAPLFIEGTLVDITVQVRAEQALRQSEALYRNLVENSRDGVFLMQHGRVEFANATLAEILGCSPEAIIGQSYFDWVAAEDLAAQAARKSAREAGSTDTQEYEIHLLRNDGSKRLCAVRAGAVEFRGAPASIGTLRDITEVRAHQRRLEAAEERYRRLFQHAVLGMFQSSLDGRLIEVNEAMAQMFGYASPAAMREGVGNMRDCYVDPAERQRALEQILRDGQIVGWEFALRRRDGSQFYALSSARIVHHSPNDEGHLEGSLLDNSARHAAEDELKFLAHHDSLTQLANRRHFELALAQALAAVGAQPGTMRAMLLLDLDRFKLVNDSLGHATGDELLIKFAERLTEAIAGLALLARYGGDEFALLSAGPVDRAGAIDLAERVQRAVRMPFQLRGHQVFSGASVGVVLIDGGYTRAEEILRDADTAMFRAKANGGGHALFDQAMHSAARERLALETDLRFALGRGELLAYYQPVFSLGERRIVGVEALVRWQHPQRGLLLPGQFLAVAEETGMLPAIDLLVLDQALGQFHHWQQRLGAAAPERLSVNICDRLFTAPSFPARLAAALAACAVPPAALHLEITETVFRGAAGSLCQTLAALKAIGVRLVVDDFGTGYSSLVSFSESDFDGLKIDRGFVHDLESNARHRAIVRTIAQFAQDLGLSLVAEGIENEVQAQLLRQLGCELVQGFHFAPPLAAAVLEPLFAGTKTAAPFASSSSG